MEQIFQTALQRAKAVSPTTTTGSAAIAAAAGQQPREFVSDRILAIGDIITIPKMEGEEVEQWLNSPAVKGGNDIFHPVCKVVSVINGVPLPAKAMPIFIGAILKELTNRENGQLVRSTIVDKSGNAVSLDDCIDLVEQWKRLAGRTFRVETIDTVPVVKRSRRTLQTYEATGTIPHLIEM